MLRIVTTLAILVFSITQNAYAFCPYGSVTKVINGRAYCVDRQQEENREYQEALRKQQAPSPLQQFGQQLRQTDFKCMNDCTSRGYMYEYCEKRCSY